MQARRDGEDRTPRPSTPGSRGIDSGPSMGLVMGLTGVVAVAAANWFFWNSGNVPGMVLFDGLSVAAGLLGFGVMRKLRGGRKRPYLDEALIEEKLKSLGFWVELQVVGTYRGLDDEMAARNSLEQIVDCLRSFDDPAGNSWRPGRVVSYSGNSVVRREYKRNRLVGDNRILGWLANQDHDVHPFVGGSQILGWLDPKRAGHTVLSAREVATVWHPPLGMSEMASMERIASGNLVPFLGDLSAAGEDSGPLVGKSGDREIHLPESSVNKHAVVLGKSGVGKSTLVKHIIDYKLRRKAAGKDDGAMIVIDPHADLVREILQLVPPEIAHKVRLLDFGRTDRVPGINLVDPNLFPDRDRCVDTIINTVKHLWDTWGGRLEDILKNSLLIVYEFNSHPDTQANREQMLTMLDILVLLQDGAVSGRGRDQTTEVSPFQRRVLARVRDQRLKNWFRMYLNWPRETRAEAVGPVFSRVGAYAANRRAAVIMGQRESTIMFSDILSEGLVLLVSTAQGTVGKQPAALMGGTIVSLVESALRDQESIETAKRARCLLVCDEFQSVTGADWEGMFAEGRKYGLSMMLATQSIARLDTQERRLKAGVLGNVGVIIGYQMSAEDAHIISAEMDSDRVSDNMLVNLLPRHCCVRIVSDTMTYPAFTMSTLPPPDVIRGTQAAVDAVLEASLQYTTDWEEAWSRLNSDVQQMLDEKVGSGTIDPEDVSLTPEPLSGLYDEAVVKGAGNHPGVARPPSVEVVPDGDADGGAPDPGWEGAGLAARADGASGVVPSVASAAPDTNDAVGPVAGGPVAGSPVAGSPSDGNRRHGQARQVSQEAKEQSRLDPVVVDYINDPNTHDPALRAALDNRLSEHVSRAYKKVDQEVDRRVEQQVEQQVGKAEADGRERGRQEGFMEGVIAAREEIVGEELGPRRRSRSLGDLDSAVPEE